MFADVVSIAAVLAAIILCTSPGGMFISFVCSAAGVLFTMSGPSVTPAVVDVLYVCPFAF